MKLARTFHWVDPEVRFRKPARLLRPGGWLALETGERYDDPFGAALLGMWAARSDDGGARVRQPHFADTEVIAGTGLFETPIHKTHTQRIVRPAEAVVGVENTRATSLSWPDDIRREFTGSCATTSGPRPRCRSPSRPPSGPGQRPGPRRARLTLDGSGAPSHDSLVVEAIHAVVRRLYRLRVATYAS